MVGHRRTERAVISPGERTIDGVPIACRQQLRPPAPAEMRPDSALSELKRNDVQAGNQLKVPDVGRSHSVAEFQSARPDQQIR